MQRFDHRPGGDLVWCRTCGQQFTRTQYRVHGHNPNQSQCGDAQCSRAAVGYVMGADLTHYNNRGAALLCGPHLLERRRKGSEIHIVDGSRCRQCGGTGEVQTRAESVGSASVRWLPCPHCQGSGYDSDPKPSAPASPPQRPAPPRVDPTVAETLGDLERRYEAPREPRPAPQPAPPTPSKQPPVESPPQRVEQQEPVQRPPPPRQAQQPPRETRPQPSQQGAPPPPAAPPPRELGDPERRPPTSASRQQGHGSSGGGCSGRLVVWLVLIALSGIGGYVASNDDLRGRIAGAFGGGDDTPAVVVSIPPPVPPTPLPTPVPVVAAPTPMPTPATVVAVAPPPPPTATPLPTPVPTQVPVPTLVPTATPIREELLASLRLQAVGLINEARAASGLEMVELVSNDSGASAAQSHADDMMKHNYLGYWWLNGEKAYMVYAANGGDSYVEENAYDIGLTDSKWNALGCSSPSPPEECNVPLPEQAIEQMHTEIMDGADNGSMRENIVGAGHRKVSIGVAWNGRRVVLVQHFEGGDVVVHDRSLQLRDGRRNLNVTLRKVGEGVAIHGVVHIYRDPYPEPLSSARVDALDRYCIGGGATSSCPAPVARVLPPGSQSADHPLDVVIAREWNETDNTFNFSVDLGLLAQFPSVYTVVFFRDTGEETPTQKLVALPAMEVR